MSQRSMSCMNDKQLQQLLLFPSGEDDCAIDSGTWHTFSSHLDHCESCSWRLESLAADEEFWNFSASSLWDDLQQTNGDESSLDFQSQLSPVLQTLLGPTELPESLGRIGRFEILAALKFWALWGMVAWEQF